MSEAIYHITPRHAWNAAQPAGEHTPEAFKKDGFIHCSRLGQVLRVANTWYRGQADLVVLKIDQDKLDHEIRWEAGTDKADELFPHLYGALNIDAVVKVFDLTASGDGFFSLPPGMT